MCDKSKWKSSGYSRGRNTLRTITTTRWERPIPGSKPYWDKICDDLEQRKEHVSESSSSSSSPSPEAITDPNSMLNSHESTSSKSNFVVEPIVKISPPTPMRMVPQRRGFTISHNLPVNENDADHRTNSNILTNSPVSLNPVHVTERTDVKLYDISLCMTELLKNHSVQSKKSCPVHKNAPPLKIFDDNLKRFLPQKKVTKKLTRNRVPPILSSVALDFSKLHRNKSCPLRKQRDLKDRMEFHISVTENSNQILHSLRRSKTEGSDKIKVASNFDQFLKVPKSPYVTVCSNLKSQKFNQISKSKILKSNLNYMLRIPKLDDVSISQNLIQFSNDFISKEAISGNLKNEVIVNAESPQDFLTNPDEYNDESGFSYSQEVVAAESEPVNICSTGYNEKIQECFLKEIVIPRLTENFKPLLGQSMNSLRPSKEISMALDSPNYGKSLSQNRISTMKLQDQPEKEFLKVPKLGAISSYPSFSKLTSRYSDEAEDNQKPVISGSTESIDSQNIESSVQQVESCKRDFLKVPKLSMMSSYPSFNSLIPDSLDSDDNATSASQLISESISTDKPKPSSLKDEITAKYDESSDLITTYNKDVSLSINSSQSQKPKRRPSLKDSVRYAYRALKFMTPNKNLDFQPYSYHSTRKSGSSSRSSDSSQASKYSKFEPAIKLLTYEDVSKDRPPIRSLSSSTYATVRSRLKQSASQYLGSDYVFLSSKARPDTLSATIPSLTRSTSGPTLDFQEPIFDRPSEITLSKLPKMSIFPRRKYDKCFACLYKAFEEPVKSRRELPLATLNAVTRESVPTLSDSESSSISFPDMKDFVGSRSEYEDNWTEILRSTKKSPLLDKIEWKAAKSPLKINLDSYRMRQPLIRASEESLSLKSDTKVENSQKNLSAKDSIAPDIHSKPMSVSSEYSKTSSHSGHSSESEEPQVQIKQAIPTNECFVSPYAPLHWAPSLEPLKALKFRKPVSMHGRTVSITKTEDDSTSDDNTTDYRSTNKETKSNNKSTQKVADKNQDSANIDSSSKSIIMFGEKSIPTKQPSVVAKIISSQLSTVTNFTKKQSKADLLSNNFKNEDQTISASNLDREILKEAKKRSQGEEIGLQKQEPMIVGPDEKKQTTDLSSHSHSVNSPNAQYVDAQSDGRSLTKTQLPQINEQSIENGMNRDDNKNLEAVKSTERSVSGENSSSDFPDHKLHVEGAQDLTRRTYQIYSSERVVEILKKCVAEHRTPLEMLEALSAVATQSDPFTNKKTITNPEIACSAQIAKNLMRLLINSKKYLNPDTFSPHLEFSSSQIPLCNPRQLRRVLPTKTYNLVARILGMPENPMTKSVDQKPNFESGHQTKDPFRLRQSRNRGLTADSLDMIVHPPSYRGDRKPIVDDEDDFEYPQQSPYALFMNKPRRKAINWRPLTERDMLGYDPEATLNMRATSVTNRICADFCQWLRGLGGAHSEDIDEEVLRDMFQIEFTAEACKTMQVLIKEIPMVPIAVALARNTPGAGELALTRRHLIRDAKAETLPKKIIGFGSMLPRVHRFVPPKNHVDKKWLQCENVPRDLETMEAIWKGITHLDSVKGFLTWVKAHPGVKPPRILTEAYAKKEALVRQPSAEEIGGHFELEMDQIESLKVGDVE